MSSLNKVMLIGNVTRDLELRYTPKTQTPVVDIGLACNRTYLTESGEKREEVTFVDVTFMGRQAETLSQYVGKGRQLYVEGRLRLETWDDRETGKKRSKISVMGASFLFLGSKAADTGTARRASPAPEPRQDDGDDIPF